MFASFWSCLAPIVDVVAPFWTSSAITVSCGVYCGITLAVIDPWHGVMRGWLEFINFLFFFASVLLWMLAYPHFLPKPALDHWEFLSMGIGALGLVVTGMLSWRTTIRFLRRVRIRT